MRNDPIFKRDGKEIKVKRGDLLPANGLTVETLDGQYVTLILSNRTAIYVKGSSKFTIESFDQVVPFRAFIADEYEAVRSHFRISIDWGDFYIAMLTPRPTSRTIIKTRYGVLEPKSTAFCILCGKKSSSFAIINGQGMFCGLDNKRDFIQQNQIGTVEEITSQKMYPLKIEPITLLQDKNYAKQLDLCKIAIQSVDFRFDNAGKMTAERLVPKEFLLRRAVFE